MKKSLFMFLAICGMLNAADSTADCVRDESTSTVTCKSTNLMWQDKDFIGDTVFDKAIKVCEDLSFATFEDWRLPNANEALSIMDYAFKKPSNQGQFVDGFAVMEDTEEYGLPFWTSTSVVLPRNKITHHQFKYVDGADDLVAGNNEGYTASVRCVRNATK